MSKIHTLTIENLKAIGSQTANFNGCTAIITGGNNTGKSTFLKSLPDRIRAKNANVSVKQGSTQGSGEMTLTDGVRFVWVFNTDGKDTLTMYTKDGIKVTNPTKDITTRYFPPTFDIDKFLQESPKEQSKLLQKALGIDFTDIDQRVKDAFEARTQANKDAERESVKLAAMGIPEAVEVVSLTELQARKETERSRLNNLYLSNKKANSEAKTAWENEKKTIDLEWVKDNQILRDAQLHFEKCANACRVIDELGFQSDTLKDWLVAQEMKIPKPYMAADFYPPEPEYITPELPDAPDLATIDAEILAASTTNEKARKYTDYVNQKQVAKDAEIAATLADETVKRLESERKSLIASAKFPAGIEINADGKITVDGFALDKNVISSSKLYTAALRIGAMNLGEVKTLYFDASYLDKNSLTEIETWANANDLQLLIERPAFDGGEIAYQLIESAEVKTTLF